MGRLVFMSMEVEGNREAVSEALRTAAGAFDALFPETIAESGEAGLITAVCASCGDEFDFLAADPAARPPTDCGRCGQ